MKKIFKYREILTVVLLSLSTYLLFFGSIFKTSHYFWGSDATFKHVPARVYIYNKIVKSGTFPFWTERMYLGFPIFSDMENAYLHPVNLLSILIFGPHLSYKLLHVMEYLVGSISIYFLLKRKQVGILGFVVTNLVYYFSTFLINHQIHYGIIMSFYLLPSSFLLSDLFIEKRKIKYIILGSLVFVNAVLWGHIQSALIMFMANFVYIMVFSFKVVKIKVVTVQLLLLSLLVTITTLPQILPTYELYKQSSRESSLNFTQGSFTPNMISFTFIPYLFGESSDYFGYSIKNKWFS